MQILRHPPHERPGPPLPRPPMRRVAQVLHCATLFQILNIALIALTALPVQMSIPQKYTKNLLHKFVLMGACRACRAGRAGRPGRAQIHKQSDLQKANTVRGRGNARGMDRLTTLSEDILKLMLRHMDACSIVALTSTCSQLRSLRSNTDAILVGISYEEDCDGDRFRSRDSIQFVLWKKNKNVGELEITKQMHNELICSCFLRQKPDRQQQRVEHYSFLAAIGATGYWTSPKITICIWNLSTNDICRLNRVFENRNQFKLGVIIDASNYVRLSKYLTTGIRPRRPHMWPEIPMQVDLIWGNYLLQIHSSVYPLLKRESYNGPRDNNDFAEPYLSFEGTTFRLVRCFDKSCF